MKIKIDREEFPLVRMIVTPYGWYENNVGLVVYCSEELNQYGSHSCQFYDENASGGINGGCVHHARIIDPTNIKLLSILYGVEK